MVTCKEPYREFSPKRLIQKMGDAAPPPQTAETAKTGETSEPKKTETGSMSLRITQVRDIAKARIDGIVKPYKNTPKEKAAEKVANAIKAHSESRFNTILAQYNQQFNEWGKSYEESPKPGEPSPAEKKIKEAEDLLADITKRLEKSTTYIEHQAEQENLTTEKREEIIEKYLSETEDTENLSPKVRQTLARLIVEGNLVNLNRGNISNYSGKLDDFFKDVEGFHEYIGQELGGEKEGEKIKAIIKKFLDETPNTNAYQHERELFKEWIGKNRTLRNNYGDPDVPGTPADKVSEVLAKRFDVRRYPNGQVAYGIDLMARPALKVLSPEDLQKTVETFLVSRDLHRENDREEYSGYVDRGNEWFNERREDIADDIDEWDEWAGHEAIADLVPINANLREQIRALQGAQKPKAQVEAEQKNEEAAKRAKETYETFKKNAVVVDNAIDKALKEGGYTQEGQQKDSISVSPDTSKEYYEAQETLWNKEEGDVIIVKLNSKGVITVHIDHTKTPDTNDTNSFRVEHTFRSTSEFSKKTLVKMVNEAKENVKKNSELLNSIYKELPGEKTKPVAVSFGRAFKFSDMAKDSFTMPPATITSDGINVGTISFNTKKQPIEATINIPGDTPETVNLDQVKTTLNKKNRELVKKAAEGKKVKNEIITQFKKEKLTNVEDLPFTPVKENDINGNFTDPEGKIQVGTFNRKDKTEAATLYIQNKSKAGKRNYELQVEGKTVATGTLDKINQYIQNNHKTLVAVKPKTEGFDGTPEQKKTKEAAKANLRKILAKDFPNLIIEGEKKDAYLNKIINKLPESSLKMLAENQEGKTMTAEGVQILKKAVKEAYSEMFGGVEAVNESEVKLISDMEVTIGNNKKKFSEVFGDQLVRILSMSHEFKTGQNGEVQVKKGSEFVTVDAKGMADYIPDSIRPIYLKKLSGEQLTDEETRQYKTGVNNEEKTRETMLLMAKATQSPEAQEAFEKMGIGEMISTFGEIYRMFQDAMKTGDWQTFEDALGEMQKGGNFGERIRNSMKSSKEKYQEEVNKIDDTGQLLSMYNDPYKSPTAIEKFDKPEKTKYRIQLKQIIEERLEKDLSLDISEMKVKSASETMITAMKGPHSLRIYVRLDGSNTYMRTEKMKNGDNGNEYVEKASEEKEVKSLRTGEKNFNDLLSLNISATQEAPPAPTPPTAEPPAETKPATPK